MQISESNQPTTQPPARHPAGFNASLSAMLDRATAEAERQDSELWRLLKAHIERMIWGRE